MENSKKPTIGFWSCVVASLLILYVAAYGILRWQDVLVYDVIVQQGNDGIWRSGLGIKRCWGEGLEKWRYPLGAEAELAFFPLCEFETVIWNKMCFPE